MTHWSLAITTLHPDLCSTSDNMVKLVCASAASTSVAGDASWGRLNTWPMALLCHNWGNLAQDLGERVAFICLSTKVQSFTSNLLICKTFAPSDFLCIPSKAASLTNLQSWYSSASVVHAKVSLFMSTPQLMVAQQSMQHNLFRALLLNDMVSPSKAFLVPVRQRVSSTKIWQG